MTERQTLEYQAAYLRGSFYGSTAAMLSLRVQLAF